MIPLPPSRLHDYNLRTKTIRLTTALHLLPLSPKPILYLYALPKSLHIAIYQRMMRQLLRTLHTLSIKPIPVFAFRIRNLLTFVFRIEHFHIARFIRAFVVESADGRGALIGALDEGAHAVVVAVTCGLRWSWVWEVAGMEERDGGVVG